MSDRRLVAVSALLFAASAALTLVWSASMSAMGDMPMPGGWAMSMTWMRMPGQTWGGAAASFLGMWGVMTVAMMLPSLVPTLRRYRRALASVRPSRLGRLTAVAGVAYFVVWIAVGLAVFPVGVAVAEVAMRQPAVARAVPVAIGAIVSLAGVFQLSAWKARRLACCRQAPGLGRASRADAVSAWRHGMRLGADCCASCAGLTGILLVSGVMDVWVMAAVTAAITVERLAPAGARIARAIGVVAIEAGVFMIVRAACGG